MSKKASDRTEIWINLLFLGKCNNDVMCVSVTDKQNAALNCGKGKYNAFMGRIGNLVVFGK